MSPSITASASCTLFSICCILYIICLWCQCCFIDPVAAGDSRAFDCVHIAEGSMCIIFSVGMVCERILLAGFVVLLVPGGLLCLYSTLGGGCVCVCVGSILHAGIPLLVGITLGAGGVLRRMFNVLSTMGCSSCASCDCCPPPSPFIVWMTSCVADIILLACVTVGLAMRLSLKSTVYDSRSFLVALMWHTCVW